MIDTGNYVILAICFLLTGVMPMKLLILKMWSFFLLYFADRASQYIYLSVNQLDAENLFYDKFISCLYMFRAPCAHRQEVKIACGIITPIGGRPVHRTATYRV